MSTSGIGGDLHGYYQLHASCYDLTRGSFLFGRKALLDALSETWWNEHGDAAPRVLELGCGTGYLLDALRSRWPKARLTGVELTQAMLAKAHRRLGDSAQLISADVLQWRPEHSFDWVICSYMLSMCGDARRAIERRARECLAPGGLLGIVDFASTPLPPFARWMRHNHVEFDPAWPERAGQGLHTKVKEDRGAYLGCWRYATLIAQSPRI